MIWFHPINYVYNMTHLNVHISRHEKQALSREWPIWIAAECPNRTQRRLRLTSHSVTLRGAWFCRGIVRLTPGPSMCVLFYCDRINSQPETGPYFSMSSPKTRWHNFYAPTGAMARSLFMGAPKKFYKSVTWETPYKIRRGGMISGAKLITSHLFMKSPKKQTIILRTRNWKRSCYRSSVSMTGCATAGKESKYDLVG